MGRTGWVATTHKASRWATQNGRPEGRWKSRAVEKSKNRLSHRAWKSRKVRGIPTFPPPRRLLEINETGHFTCYQKRTSSLANNREFDSDPAGGRVGAGDPSARWGKTRAFGMTPEGVIHEND